METKTVYFEKPGENNTEQVFTVVKQRAADAGIKTILIASTRGEVAVNAADYFKGLRVVAVSHSTGFKQANTQFFTAENKKAFESKGGTLVTNTHVFAGLSRAVKNQFNTIVIGDLVANVLRVFGEGMKVVCEISMMAADAGAVRTDEDIIVIAGTNKGSDTAVLLTPVNSQSFFSLKIKEILCKPHF